MFASFSSKGREAEDFFFFSRKKNERKKGGREQDALVREKSST
jgi:hypothetical protein